MRHSGAAARQRTSLPFYLRWRERLVAELAGDILEIGVGKGENLTHYSRARGVCAIEPDSERAQKALHVARGCSVAVQISVAAAEGLPYAADRFDHVVSSLVFCSVRDQEQTLNEINRVLRVGGTLEMVEHVRPQTPYLAWIFGRATPWWRRVACNCHLDRPTVDLLTDRGWHVRIRRRRGMFVRMTATPPA